MIACMWGEASHLEETVSTLRLASRMMRVQNETVSVETVDPSALIKKQEKIIKALKQELLMHDALVERTGVAYEPYTPEQQESISQMLERYMVASEIEEENVLNITNYRQMLEICKQFKKKVLSARNDVKVAQEQMFLGGTLSPSGRVRTAAENGGAAGAMGDMGGTAGMGGAGGADYSADSKIAQKYDPSAPTVGEVGGGGGAAGATGFALGVSYADSRPLNGIEGASSYAAGSSAVAGAKSSSPPSSPQRDPVGGMTGAKATAGIMSSPDASPVARGARTIDFSASDMAGVGGAATQNMGLFESFVKAEGEALFREFTQCKANLKEHRSKSKELVDAVNEIKVAIDKLQRDVDVRKSSRLEFLRSSAKASAKDEIVDEEEFRLTKELKDAKVKYRTNFEQMQKHKKGAMEAQARSEQLKNDLGRAYNQWSLGVTGSLQGGGGGGGAGLSQPGSPDFRGMAMDTYDGGGATGDANFDQLDDQEAFDKLEVERVMQNDPESLAFFHAQKTRRANITQKGGTLRRLQKNKRFT
mmetsp:Transcript_24786/g.41294  ORF Transcript_24786/g.41294 Transcript_24786/m.41294 type:complete len:532 (+) Transcript_24786:1017-2612(+)